MMNFLHSRKSKAAQTGSEYIVEPDIYIGESRDKLIIHKGYAYCTYYQKVGKGKDGFRGSDTIRIDIKSEEPKNACD